MTAKRACERGFIYLPQWRFTKLITFGYAIVKFCSASEDDIFVIFGQRAEL
jgi:hypothetical protein